MTTDPEPENPAAPVGRLLTQFRERAGLTQQQLADALRMHAQRIGYWERVRIDASQLDAIVAALHLTADEANLLVLGRLPALDPGWLARQEENRQAGLLLAALRERAGFSQEDLGQRLGVWPQTVTQWENGSFLLDKRWIDALAEMFRLDGTTLTRWIFARWPALDPVWLARQEENRRAGLLLAALRERAGLSQQQLADAIGVNVITVVRLESGETPVNATQIAEASQVLGLAPEETQCLQFARWPALKPGWLVEQGQDKQAGLLLAAFRERAGLTQQQLADAIGINVSTVVRWENGGLVKHRYADAMVKLYRKMAAGQDGWFGGVEAERLQGICAMPRARLKSKAWRYAPR